MKRINIKTACLETISIRLERCWSVLWFCRFVTLPRGVKVIPLRNSQPTAEICHLPVCLPALQLTRTRVLNFTPLSVSSERGSQASVFLSHSRSRYLASIPLLLAHRLPTAPSQSRPGPAHSADRLRCLSAVSLHRLLTLSVADDVALDDTVAVRWSFPLQSDGARGCFYDSELGRGLRFI